jgi:subtilase family serine protease
MKMFALTAATAAVVLAVFGGVGGAANVHANAAAVCPAAPGATHCHALVATDAHGNPDASPAPSGLSPATMAGAYGWTTDPSAGKGQTIAIVDAYDDPTAESDLNVFSQQFGLPACTTTNLCFSKVSQTGTKRYPRANSGWALEIALDIEWAHAIAPGAKILLVEASSNSFANLLAAEDWAAAHASYVSNSWGGSEFSGENTYDSHFTTSGVSYFVSAGDNGTPAEYPSSSPSVVSVGGTTLSFSGGKVTETGWSDGGGGCSAYEAGSSAQVAFESLCGSRRGTPDISADADPASGAAVYDSTSYSGRRGWFTVGGTSLSSPMLAAHAAVLGVQVTPSYIYGGPIVVSDIKVGNNGAACGDGYDLCTGRGSWTSLRP